MDGFLDAWKFSFKKWKMSDARDKIALTHLGVCRMSAKAVCCRMPSSSFILSHWLLLCLKDQLGTVSYLCLTALHQLFWPLDLDVRKLRKKGSNFKKYLSLMDKSAKAFISKCCTASQLCKSSTSVNSWALFYLSCANYFLGILDLSDKPHPNSNTWCVWHIWTLHVFDTSDSKDNWKRAILCSAAVNDRRT